MVPAFGFKAWGQCPRGSNRTINHACHIANGTKHTYTHKQAVTLKAEVNTLYFVLGVSLCSHAVLDYEMSYRIAMVRVSRTTKV